MIPRVQLRRSNCPATFRSPPQGTSLFRLAAGALCLGILLAGCTARQHRKAADREAYGIIRAGQQRVLGHTNAFTVETPYSRRDPQTIPPQEIIEDRLQAGHRLLTIEEALNLAVSHSRRYQTEKERLYLTALNLSDARYEFGPKFSAGTKGTLERLSDGERTGSLNSDVGVSQALKTGGRLGVSIANDLLRYYTGNPRRSAVSTISANLFQPLLRGFGKNSSAVESLTQAERDVIYGVRSFSFFQNSFAVEIVKDYFGLLAQKDIVRNRYTNFLSRVKSTQRLEARAVDRERAVDVDQTRQAELTARNNYVNAVASYITAVEQFKLKLGLPLGERIQLDDRVLADLKSRGPVPVPVPRDDAYRLAVERQFEILNAIDRYEDSRRKIKVSAGQLKAELNLFADASLESEKPTDYTRFDPDRVRADVGVELKLPLDRLRERNNYRATLISFESELRALSLSLDTLRDNIHGGLRTLELRRQNYQIQKSALELADRRVYSTSLLLEAGRAEVRDLVEAQDAQIAAQNAVTAALVAYQDALLAMLLDIGVLETESPKFWLKDHLASHFPAAAPTPSELALPKGELIPPNVLFKDTQ